MSAVSEEIVTADTPVPFSAKELIEYLENQKNEKTYMMDGISLEKEQPEKEN